MVVLCITLVVCGTTVSVLVVGTDTAGVSGAVGVAGVISFVGVVVTGGTTTLGTGAAT